MKYAHLIKITAFSYDYENSDDTANAFLTLFPFSLEEEKIILKKNVATGFNERKITILEVILTKPSLISRFLTHLLANLDENQKKKILTQTDSRLDKDLNFFLRFDKDAWINEKKLALTDTGKCFHIKIRIAAFPRKREVALNIIKDMFSSK